jgi:Helix-turn-helix domain
MRRIHRPQTRFESVFGTTARCTAALEGVDGVIHKAAILRLYRNRQQATSLRRWTGGLRFVWNATLAWCNDQRTVSGKWPNKSGIQAFIVGLKKEEASAWVAGIPAHALFSLAADVHAVRTAGRFTPCRSPIAG